MQLAESMTDVAAVHLVDLMLNGNEEIDWVAGYAAIEVVEHDLQGRNLDGRELDWWSKKEMGISKRRPTALRSSALALGTERRPV
jgi:hypothetical protein